MRRKRRGVAVGRRTTVGEACADVSCGLFLSGVWCALLLCLGEVVDACHPAIVSDSMASLFSVCFDVVRGRPTGGPLLCTSALLAATVAVECEVVL